MTIGVSVPRKYIRTIESFCSNNNIKYNFGVKSASYADDVDLLFKTKEDQAKVAIFLARMTKLDSNDEE